MPADVSALSTENSESDEELRKQPRRWPLWKLCMLAAPQMGVQVLWCFLGPNSAPYMRRLGCPDALATLNNIAGPITGFFTGPYVGAKSDRGTWRMGRRRPVILFGLISMWIAGILFAGAEYVLPEGSAVFFAAPMYWVLDVTINIMQTPHRALVSDLAHEDQDLTMQVVFVVFMSIGNFMGSSIMRIFPNPTEVMLELMIVVAAFNTLLIGIQAFFGTETPIPVDPTAPKTTVCTPIKEVVVAVKNSPKLLYHLAAVQCLVWVANTAWSGYGLMYFGNTVFEGNSTAPSHSEAKHLYEQGVDAFGFAGQMKSVAQLISSFAIIFVILQTNLRPRTIYAPCILIGAIGCWLAAVVVHHDATLAEICMVMSIMPETGSFAIPFGLVATLNKRAEAEGKPVNKAIQMAMLNCCITVGQQICTLFVSGLLLGLPMKVALARLFILGGACQSLATLMAWLMDDSDKGKGGAPAETSASSGTEDTSSTEE